MPFINVKTNTAVSRDNALKIKTVLGGIITDLPGKSEKMLMFNIEGECKLFFQGTDEPAAMVEVSIPGTASPYDIGVLNAKLITLIAVELNIPDSRIYISYKSMPDWGWRAPTE